MKKFPFLALLIILLFIFFQINSSNYKVIKKIKNNLVEHPENLTTKEAAKASSFGFQNVRADIFWLQTIQYIGGNAISSAYKKYLFVMMDTVTHLNPYFEHPYVISLLLLPSDSLKDIDVTEQEQEKYQEQAITIGLKGIKNFCNPEIIAMIEKEDDLRKIWTEEKFKNPCKTYSIPYYLAYVYYQYKNDGLMASKYYKIASANDNSPEGAKILAAIMQGKGGNREKGFFMFLNIAKFIDSKNEACNNFANELENIGAGIFISKELPLSGKFIEGVEKQRNALFGTFDEEKEDKLLSDTECQNYVNKATRELNLIYIEEANARYMSEHPNGLPALTAQGLFEDGYIDFLPTDFQQYGDYGIVYKYDLEKKRYDYVIGEY